MSNGELKSQVKEFWNRQSCDTQVATSQKFTREYFEEIESFRYKDQPFIHSFAQFSRFHGKKVLEVGFGSGTDFIQWLRVGANASGVDLTQEALDNLTHRVQVYNLPLPERIMVGDAENLVFPNNTFDLGYSFGVLHHTPNTEKAISELVRVVKPGGEIKIMLYNRHSIYVLNQWIKHALLKGRFWKSLGWVLWHYMESVGTKSYTTRELRNILSALPLENIHIHTEVTSADYLSARAFPPLNWLNRLALRLASGGHDWWNLKFVARAGVSGGGGGSRNSNRVPTTQAVATGNPLGFFHCISARKAGGS